MLVGIALQVQYYKNSKQMSFLEILGAIPGVGLDVPQGSSDWYNCKPFDNTFINVCWMEYLQDSRPVSLISIPGTHNSASYAAQLHHYRRSSKCQKWNLYQQLRAGIRFLDMRVRSGEELKMAHGQKVTMNHFQEEVDQIEKFLRENPKEFIILSFKRDGGEEWDPTHKIQEYFYVPCKNPHHNTDKIEAVYFNHIPTVGELRGKVWIIRSWGVGFHGKTLQVCGFGFQFERFPLPQDLNSHCFIQNSWYVDTDSREFKGNKYISIEQKSSRVLQTALLVENGTNRLKINYLSGSGPILPFRTIVYPYILAQNKNGPNAQLLQALKKEENRNAIMGIAVMDFPGYELISQIIRTNFK